MTILDDTSSQEDHSSSEHNPLSNPTLQDASSFIDSGVQSITETHQSNPSHRTRHHYQSDILTRSNFNKSQNKTNYILRQQPRKDY